MGCTESCGQQGFLIQFQSLSIPVQWSDLRASKLLKNTQFCLDFLYYKYQAYLSFLFWSLIKKKQSLAMESFLHIHQVPL